MPMMNKLIPASDRIKTSFRSIFKNEIESFQDSGPLQLGASTIGRNK